MSSSNGIFRRTALSCGIALMAVLAGPGAAVPLTFTTIDYPDAVVTQAIRINNAGDIVGYAGPVPGQYNSVGWKWSGGSFDAPIAYPGAPFNCGMVPNAPASTAAGISDTGVIVGYYSVGCSTPRYGFVFDGSSYTQVDIAPSISTTVTDINAAGTLVGSSYLGGSDFRGYTRDADGNIVFLEHGEGRTDALGINDAGDVVGYFGPLTNDAFSGYLYSGSNWTTIAVPGALGTYALDINNAGVVAGIFQSAAGFHGFTWSNGTFDIIDAPLGANGTFVQGLNDAGALVGFYIDAQNVTHGFLAMPGEEGAREEPAQDPSAATVPVPGTLALASCALMVLCSRRRSRRAGGA